MDCPVCGHSNRSGASFCSNCGSRLVDACPSCSAQVEAGSSFCPACGIGLSDTRSGDADIARYVPEELLRKLEAARRGRTMAGERRTVTMLFADVQGSTAAAEQLDPEEWAEIVNGAFERLIRPVYRYEGTLARLMGDGVLAFFGAPIAHEDDAERAVRAGLAMLADIGPYALEVSKRWGIAFDVRVGVNTGLVVVGEVGSDLRVEYTALGDAVNVAARMEQTAAPGTLQIAEPTQRLVDGLFHLDPLDPIAVKGKSEPVGAYRVTGVLDRPASLRGIPGRTAPLLGRDRELDVLRRFVESLRSGSGQVCSVIGEAGVGKSRLVDALREELEAADCLVPWLASADSGVSLRWAEGRCLSYDSSVPYAPFIDLFSRSMGLETQDSMEVRRGRVAAYAARAGGVDDDDTVAYLCALLGIDPGGDAAAVIAGHDPPELQRRIFKAVVDLVTACVNDRPSVIVIEDVHWADPVSLALLEDLIRLTDHVSLGVLFLMRPYKEDAAWGVHEMASREFEHRYSSIRLQALESEAVTEMVDALMAAESTPAVTQAILARSEGNPFFVEELVRTALERAHTEQASDALPDTIAAVLTARLDRLGDASKLLVQLGSVIGREFEFGELVDLVGDAEVVDRGLADLLRRDVLEERDRIPVRRYAFRHALIQETAHSSILLKTRRALHGQVADRLIGLGGAPVEVARHLIEARQEARAVPFLVEAGDASTRAMSLADAIRHYDLALRWAEGDEVELIRRAHEGLGAAYTLIPDLTHASASFQQMLEFGRRRAEPSVQITALNRLGFTAAFLGGDFDAATGYLEDARRLAEEHGDDGGLAEYHMNSCMIATTRGDLEKAAAHDAETARLGEAIGSAEVHAGGLIQRALSLAHGAMFEDGERALEQAKRVTAGTTDLTAIASLSMAESFFEWRRGNLRRASEFARRGADLAARVGSSLASVAGGAAGSLAAMTGDFETALAYLGSAVRAGEESGQTFNAAPAAAAMSALYVEMGLAGGEPDELEAKALEYLGGPMGTTMESTVLAELGWSRVWSERPQEALDFFSSGLSGVSASKLLETPSLLLGAALVESQSERHEAGESLLAEAEVFVDERGMDFYRPAIGLIGGSIAIARGNPAVALDRLEAGRAPAEDHGFDRVAWRIRSQMAVACLGLGRPDEASRHAAAAQEIVDRILDRIADPSLRDSFQQVSGRWLAAVSID